MADDNTNTQQQPPSQVSTPRTWIGHKIRGINVIGYERPFGAEPSGSGDRREHAWPVAGWGLDSVQDVGGPGLQPCCPAVVT
jgi:hypothetical protein